MDGFVAFARGDRSAAAEKYAESAEYLRAYSIDTTPEVDEGRAKGKVVISMEVAPPRI